MLNKIKNPETLPNGSIISLRYPHGFKYEPKEVFAIISQNSVSPRLSIAAATLSQEAKDKFDALHYPGGYTLSLIQTNAGQYRLIVKAENIIASTSYRLEKEEVHRLLELYYQTTA